MGESNKIEELKHARNGKTSAWVKFLLFLALKKNKKKIFFKYKLNNKGEDFIKKRELYRHHLISKLFKQTY